ncbi:DUF5946 family protein [Amycolatopsis thermalba]|uniref:DUF5946 family protein n=1 Tax=Amycolatopsis thermalba TaxID=944492 RepID=A0ABY4NUY3_9PSEU|nr:MULTISPECIES: DUF5946 family protein [Amycolatopsis]UQS23889.1 DUF5946 family protein [Amycolatopsis thermalba]
MTPCAECGAPGKPCAELFHTVLALDHSRRPPWGPLHGVTVACFLLQHPSRLPERDRARVWQVLRTYLDEGATGLATLTARARRANSHRNRRAAAPGAPPPPPGPAPTSFSVTIADVAQDGTFPAAGFPERVRAWALATVTAWGNG